MGYMGINCLFHRDLAKEKITNVVIIMSMLDHRQHDHQILVTMIVLSTISIFGSDLVTKDSWGEARERMG